MYFVSQHKLLTQGGKMTSNEGIDVNVSKIIKGFVSVRPVVKARKAVGRDGMRATTATRQLSP